MADGAGARAARHGPEHGAAGAQLGDAVARHVRAVRRGAADAGDGPAAAAVRGQGGVRGSCAEERMRVHSRKMVLEGAQGRAVQSAIKEALEALPPSACPRCGGPLVFTPVVGGLGEIRESCDRAPACGHTRTVPRIPLPASRRAPRIGDEEEALAALRRRPTSDPRLPETMGFTPFALAEIRRRREAGEPQGVPMQVEPRSRRDVEVNLVKRSDREVRGMPVPRPRVARVTGGPRLGRGQAQAALLAALPTCEAEKMGPAEIAVKAGVRTSVTCVLLLKLAEREPSVRRVNVSRGTKPRWLYWRAA